MLKFLHNISISLEQINIFKARVIAELTVFIKLLYKIIHLCNHILYEQTIKHMSLFQPLPYLSGEEIEHRVSQNFVPAVS
jgi:Zn-dependent M32 family carboxypeptidase